MALVLKKTTSYEWPVSFDIPADGGRFDKISFTAKFERVHQARIDAIVAEMRSENSGVNDQSITDEVLIGWDKVNDEDGNPLDFTPVNRAAVLDIPGVRAAVVRAWFESLAGTKRKN